METEVSVCDQRLPDLQNLDFSGEPRTGLLPGIPGQSLPQEDKRKDDTILAFLPGLTMRSHILF